MNELDDRLVGDPVWELFPSVPSGPSSGPWRSRRARLDLAAAVVVALAWPFSPTVSVVVACLAISCREIAAGRRIARAIPGDAGGRIGVLFTWAWGALKLGIFAFVLMLLGIAVTAWTGRDPDDTPALFLPMGVWFLALMASAVLTACGLLKAYRSGFRIWVGEGINRARTLLMWMLIVGFVVMLIPVLIWMTRPADRQAIPLAGLAFMACVYAGPVVILGVLDRLCRRVVADRPAKFGKKVAAVGKWDPVSDDLAE